MTFVPSNSRTHPQDGAASYNHESEDEVARRETTVGESSQSSRNQNPTPVQAGSPRHEGAESQRHMRFSRTRNLPKEIKTT